MKAVIYYLKWALRVLKWALRLSAHFSGPLIAIAAPLALGLFMPNELGFRVVGFLLQVLGVWIVWKGISETRAQFEVPSFWAQTKMLFADFPRFRGQRIVAAVGIATGVSMAAGRAHAWHGAGENPSLEKRVEAIEKNLRNVRDDLSAYQKETDDRARAYDNEMKRERSEREAADKAIHEKIKETETGGLHLNWSGVWWLFSGTVCSTFPQELAGVANWILS